MSSGRLAARPPYSVAVTWPFGAKERVTVDSETLSPASARCSVRLAWSSVACALWRLASRAVVSSVASGWPAVTVAPGVTATVATVPATGKATAAWVTGSMVATPWSMASTSRWRRRRRAVLRGTRGRRPQGQRDASAGHGHHHDDAQRGAERVVVRGAVVPAATEEGNIDATSTLAGLAGRSPTGGVGSVISLAPEGVDGRQAGGARGGVDPEGHTDGDGHHDGADGGGDGDDHP